MSDEEEYSRKIAELKRELKQERRGLHFAIALFFLVETAIPMINKYIERTTGKKQPIIFTIDLLFPDIPVNTIKVDSSSKSNLPHLAL